MSSIYSLVVAIQVLTALVIIGLVLVQHGKGADMGAAFGSGASGSLFGATGSSSFLSKSTGIAAAVFFCATLALAYLGNARTAPASGVMDNLSAPKVTATEGIPPTSAADTKPAVEQPAVQGTTAPTPASAPASSTTNPVDQIPK
jgi:preprotein translocase subunit SecG